MSDSVVGTSRRRLEGRRKVLGRTGFTADLRIPDLCHVRLVLSPHAAARITGYELDAAKAVPGVVDVVGETAAAAADGAALVRVDFDPLPAVTDVEQALKPDAPHVLDKGDGADEVSDHAAAVA